MITRTLWLSAVLLCARLVAVPAQTSAPASTSARAAGRRDTIDVAVGSRLVDFSKHRPGATIAHQEMVMGSQTMPGGATLWRFSFADSGAAHLLIVQPEPQNRPAGAPTPPATVFDRSTLAPLRTINPTTSAPILSIDGGTHVHGTISGPGGSVAVDATLTTPGFFAPLADLVAESLPRRVGAIYRLPLWGVPNPAIELHLYEFVRRENVTVLGKTYANAWVVEDRLAADGRLLGTMWLTDGPPELVRWHINRPNGAVLHLDQEVVPAS